MTALPDRSVLPVYPAPDHCPAAETDDFSIPTVVRPPEAWGRLAEEPTYPSSEDELATVPCRPAVSPAEARWAAGLDLVAPAGNRSPAYLRAKRLCDFVGATVLLLILGPLLLAVWLILCFTTRGKPVFRQERIGYLGRPFTMYKFRTMLDGAEAMKHLVENEQGGPVFKNRRDPRVTRLGRILRSTSIDEMPQLFNVLAGHMALVGPRPPVRQEVLHYTSAQLRRLAVQPGLTCLWQVSGRSEVGFDKWVHMDLWYVRHQCLWTDLKLLAKTPWTVLTGRGAY